MGFFLEKIKNVAFEWSASVMYDTPEEGVDYQSLDYNRREEPYFETSLEHRKYYRSYLHSAKNKQALKPGYEWMKSLDPFAVSYFVDLYLAFYCGSVQDAWFFFKYHYQEFVKDHYAVFKDYDKYLAYSEKQKKEYEEQLDAIYPERKEQNNTYDDDDDDDYYGPFTRDELAEYYGYQKSCGSMDDFFDDL